MAKETLFLFEMLLGPQYFEALTTTHQWIIIRRVSGGFTLTHDVHRQLFENQKYLLRLTSLSQPWIITPFRPVFVNGFTMVELTDELKDLTFNAQTIRTIYRNQSFDEVDFHVEFGQDLVENGWKREGNEWKGQLMTMEDAYDRENAWVKELKAQAVSDSIIALIGNFIWMRYKDLMKKAEEYQILYKEPETIYW